MKSSFLALPLALLFSPVVFAGSFACDEQFEVQSSNGSPAIDCRVYGAVAENLYDSLSAQEVPAQDEEGQASGFTKETTFTSCYASAHKTSFQCDEILDAQTGERKPVR